MTNSQIIEVINKSCKDNIDNDVNIINYIGQLIPDLTIFDILENKYFTGNLSENNMWFIYNPKETKLYKFDLPFDRNLFLSHQPITIPDSHDVTDINFTYKFSVNSSKTITHISFIHNQKYVNIVVYDKQNMDTLVPNKNTTIELNSSEDYIIGVVF